MQKYCIIKQKENLLSLLIDENGHTTEIHCDNLNQGLSLGTIYIGRVKNIAKNLNAAFVEVQPGVICYLSLEDLQTPIYTKKGTSAHLQQGDELVVQISREAIKTKAPSLTTALSFQGKYTVVEYGKEEIGVSKKLPEKQRVLLKEAGTQCLQKLRETRQEMMEKIPVGLLLRTNAAQAEPEQIDAEITAVMERLETIRKAAPYRTCFSCLYQPPALWMKRILSLPYHEIEGILIEEEELYHQAEKFLREEQSELIQYLKKYEDPLLSLGKLYSLEHRLEEALGERVWMRSGAYLVIQPTEALTVIDVNSGKNETGKKREALALKVNLEAARETARQLRLRNISGIIIVDFINMTEENSRKQLMEELRRCLAQDPVRATLVDMTKLYLVEITRKKVERPLAESLQEWKRRV